MNNVQQCRISAGLARWFSCDENEGLHTTIGGNCVCRFFRRPAVDAHGRRSAFVD